MLHCRGKEQNLLLFLTFFFFLSAVLLSILEVLLRLPTVTFSPEKAGYCLLSQPPSQSVNTLADREGWQTDKWVVAFYFK